MKAWFENFVAQLNALFAPRVEPVRIRSQERERLAEEQRRRPRR